METQLNELIPPLDNRGPIELLMRLSHPGLSLVCLWACLRGPLFAPHLWPVAPPASRVQSGEGSICTKKCAYLLPCIPLLARLHSTPGHWYWEKESLGGLGRGGRRELQVLGVAMRYLYILRGSYLFWRQTFNEWMNFLILNFETQVLIIGGAQSRVSTHLVFWSLKLWLSVELMGLGHTTSWWIWTAVPILNAWRVRYKWYLFFYVHNIYMESCPRGLIKLGPCFQLKHLSGLR